MSHSPAVLVVFHTGEGQTATIAHHIGRRLDDRGARTTVRSVDDAPPPAGFDAVVIGDSIHLGRHSRELTDYATSHCEAINSGPAALFQVSLASAQSDDESVQLASQMVDDFCTATGVEPDRVGLFAGALAYSRYRGVRRFLMRHIAEKGALDTDSSHDHSYTDWNAVDDFADAVMRLARRSAGSIGGGDLVDFAAPSVAPDTSLRGVVDAMLAGSGDAVLVRSDDVDPLCTDGVLDVVGIITEHDIVAVVHEGADIDNVWAADVMSRAPISVSVSAQLETMATEMAEQHFRHLVVRDDNGHVGLVSSTALLGAITGPNEP